MLERSVRVVSASHVSTLPGDFITGHSRHHSGESSKNGLPPIIGAVLGYNRSSKADHGKHSSRTLSDAKKNAKRRSSSYRHAAHQGQSKLRVPRRRPCSKGLMPILVVVCARVFYGLQRWRSRSLHSVGQVGEVTSPPSSSQSPSYTHELGVKHGLVAYVCAASPRRSSRGT
jgi:hypothetical protein